MQALIMVGINILLSAALWGIGMLLRRPTHTTVGAIKNREIQISSYGEQKPILYGQTKTAMSLIHAEDLQPVAVTTEVGKGGGDTVTQIYYLATWAGIWGITPDTSIFGIPKLLKLYCDDRLVYNAVADDEKVIKQSKWVAKKFKFYDGTQVSADAVLESKLGSGNVPAYKHKVYGRVNGLNVIDYGNRIPTMRAVVAPGTAAELSVNPVIGYGLVNEENGPGWECGVAVTQNDMFIITGQYNYIDSPYTEFEWKKVSVNDRSVITSYVYPYAEPEMIDDDPEDYCAFQYTYAFDLDELDRIYCPTCFGLGKMARLNSDTFSVQQLGPEDCPDFIGLSMCRVSRNPSYPYLWGQNCGIESGTNVTPTVYLFNRETLANPFDPADYGFAFYSPVDHVVGEILYYIGAMAVNHLDGSCFTLWTDYYSDDAYISRLYPNGNRQDINISSWYSPNHYHDAYSWHSMCYDSDSNQIILNWSGYIDPEIITKIIIIDADDFSYIDEIEYDYCFPYHNWGSFQRGIINGKITLTDQWSGILVIIDVNERTATTYDISSYIDIVDNDHGLAGSFGIISYRDSVFIFGRADGSDMQEVLLNRIDIGSVSLDKVVADICYRSGFTAGQINVAQLSSDVVKGYCVSQDQASREALEPLMEVYIFDFVDVDGVLTAVKRGGPSIATIPEADLAAFKFGSSRPTPLEIEFQEETELPRRLEVHYSDINRKHELGVQHYQRQVTDSKLISKIQSQVLMDADDAKQLAHIATRYAWNSRPCELTLGPKHSRLMPLDVVTIQKSEGDYRVLLLSAKRNGLQTDWQGVVEKFNYVPQVTWQGDWSSPTTYSTDDVVSYDGVWYVSVQDNNTDKEPTVDSDWESWWELYEGDDAYLSDETGDPGPAVDEDVHYAGPSIYYLLDLPPLLDTHDYASVYMASGALLEDWSGCQVWISKDAGETWAFLKSIPQRSVTGVVTVPLDDHEFVARDRHSSMTIRWDYDDDALSSVTESQLLQGQGHYLAIVKINGDIEVVCARDVTTNGDGTQTLTNFVRGVKGTEHARTDHIAGEKVIKLDMNTVVLASLDATYLNQSYLYSGISSGDDWEDGSRKVFETDLNTLKPWSGVQAEGARDGSNNLTITWNRRNRLYGFYELVTGNEIPMSESSESYQVDIYDGDTVVRTITGLTSESASYSAAEQTADGLTPGDPVDCRIYQISAVVGRGWPLTATV